MGLWFAVRVKGQIRGCGLGCRPSRQRRTVTRPSFSAPNRGAEYCDDRVCVCVCGVCVSLCSCVCLSVRGHVFRTTRPIFTKLLCMLSLMGRYPRW